MVVLKSQYYAQINGFDPADCAPANRGNGLEMIGPHATEIMAITDDDPGFVAWCTTKGVQWASAGPVPTLSSIINAKYAEITETFSARTRSAVAEFTQEDINSWFRQEKEATAILADPTAYPNGFLAARAARRGCTVVEVAQTVMALTDQLAPYYGDLVERKRILLEQLAMIDSAGDYATGCAAVAAIVW